MTLYFERMKRFANKFKDNFIVNKTASFVILSAMLPLSVLSADTNTMSENPRANDNIVLNTTSPKPVVINQEKSTIVPGESKVEKEAREKAEANAKVKSSAEAVKLRNTVARESRVYNNPSDFDSIYARAQATYGVDARILKAIHTVETGRSGSTLRANPSGATGPMQFLPSTWRRHGVDGNGDGVADIGNVEDAIFSAAHYLKACGYPDVKKALWGYNPSSRYYTKVMNIAGL
jgi:peptidoglycan LD-endopeptidase LytH